MTDLHAVPLIVVGVDGSPLAMTALEFAVEEARLRDAMLREFLQGLVAKAPSTEGIVVEWLATPGNPSEVLIEASREATLLVIGSRGVGGFMGLLMGSVSTQCVHYSHCPVLVVREEH